jgi:hypothetical protein
MAGVGLYEKLASVVAYEEPGARKQKAQSHELG